MTQNKAKIAINAKPLGPFAHLYILYTDSNGHEKVFSGGPGNRESAGFKMYYENLKVFFAEYREGHPDFQKLEEEKIKPRPSTLIYEGSDADAKISKMLSLLEKINAGQHDYKIPVPNWIRKVFGSDVAHCHNSNTVIRVLVEEAGLEFKLPVDKSGKEVNAICFDSEIKDTAFDKFLKSEEMTDEEIDIVTWELIALSAGGGAGGIALRVIGSRLYNWIKDALRERKKKDDNDPSDDEDDDLNSGGAVAASSMKAAKVVPTGPIIGKRELQEIIEESRAEVKIAEEEVREYYKEEANLGKNVLTEEEFQKKVLEHLQLKERVYPINCVNFLEPLKSTIKFDYKMSHSFICRSQDLILQTVVNFIPDCQLSFDCQICNRDTRFHYSFQQLTFYYPEKFA